MNINVVFIENIKDLATSQETSMRKMLEWKLRDLNVVDWEIVTEDCGSGCAFALKGRNDMYSFSTYLVTARKSSIESEKYTFEIEMEDNLFKHCEVSDKDSRVLFVVDRCLDEDDQDYMTGELFAKNELRIRFADDTHKDIIYTTGHPKFFIENTKDENLYRRAVFENQMNDRMRAQMIARDYVGLEKDFKNVELYNVIHSLLCNGSINAQYIGGVLFRIEKLICGGEYHES